MKRRITILVLVVFLLAGAAALYYTRVYLPSKVVPEPTISTTKVRSGDISISTSGIGSILPAEKISVGFQMNGIISELNVEVGSKVKAGDVIARIDSLDLQAQQATDELNVLSAQQALDDLFSNLKDEQARAKIDLVKAEKNLAEARYNLDIYQNQRCSSASVTLYNGNLLLAQNEYNAQLLDFNTNYASLPENDERKILAYSRLYNAEVALNNARYTLAYCTGSSDTWTTDDLRATLEMAQVVYDTAFQQVEMLKNGPDPAKVALAQAKLKQATLQLQTTVEDLKKTALRAPASGTVTAVNALVGQPVGTSAIITIETLDTMLLKFYVEEQDISMVAVDYPIQVVFKAYPETPVAGKVTYVEPALQSVDGDMAVVAWASLDNVSGISLITGMSADVEVVAGEAKNSLLVPVQALRQLAPDSFAVFIVLSDGTMKLTPVSVGLKDYANAQILSGLKVGDVVSTGLVETK